ncbi:peptide ligase PGM1-related protein [Haliangium sp.]|uniref:peptide ligase PGM1-related protein n=1 Tax=Haliangium sp. TaxID=2663208 RepID=UPI003D0C6E0F
MSISSPLPPDDARFEALERALVEQFRTIFPDRRASRTVVVIPSLSFDAQVLAKIKGVQHYEERMLCMLMLLRMPRTRVIYVTSQPVPQPVVDYYLHLLPGVPSSHARRRLTMLACYDGSITPVADKILARPRLVERIRREIRDPARTHMNCFTATMSERALALRLGIPLYATDPTRSDLGSKSGSREVFRAAGAPLADGFERLHDMDEVAEALTELGQRHPDLSRAVVKLEEGASGEGNAVFSYLGRPQGQGLRAWIDAELPARLAFEASNETWDEYSAKFREMGGIVEAWVEGRDKRSPSVQCRIDPLGGTEIISTHDQILGGPSGQVFLGSTFPADDAYRLDIQAIGLDVANLLRDRGALGRFGVDFVSVAKPDGTWEHYAIEVNLRKGGTTHTYMMLQFLTDGRYRVDTGLFETLTGQHRYYYASDNITNPDYCRLTPGDVIDIAVDVGLHFHGATQQGVVFHLIGAVSEFGKLGVLCVGDSPERARELYDHTVATLDREALDDDVHR